MRGENERFMLPFLSGWSSSFERIDQGYRISIGKKRMSQSSVEFRGEDDFQERSCHSMDDGEQGLTMEWH